jgi:hypothetical protein
MGVGDVLSCWENGDAGDYLRAGVGLGEAEGEFGIEIAQAKGVK